MTLTCSSPSRARGYTRLIALDIRTYVDIRESRLASSTNYVIRTRQYTSSRGETDACQQKQNARETDRTARTRNVCAPASRVYVTRRITTHRAGRKAPAESAVHRWKRVNAIIIKRSRRAAAQRPCRTRMRVTPCLHRTTSATRPRPRLSADRESYDGAKYLAPLDTKSLWMFLSFVPARNDVMQDGMFRV